MSQQSVGRRDCSRDDEVWEELWELIEQPGVVGAGEPQVLIDTHGLVDDGSVHEGVAAQTEEDGDDGAHEQHCAEDLCLYA